MASTGLWWPCAQLESSANGPSMNVFNCRGSFTAPLPQHTAPRCSAVGCINAKSHFPASAWSTVLNAMLCRGPWLLEGCREKEKPFNPGAALIPRPTAFTYASFNVHSFMKCSARDSPSGRPAAAKARHTISTLRVLQAYPTSAFG